MLDQYDRLRKRNAFMEMYKKEKMFQDGLEEFDLARYALSDPRATHPPPTLLC
jgi:tubulin gamma